MRDVGIEDVGVTMMGIPTTGYNIYFRGHLAGGEEYELENNDPEERYQYWLEAGTKVSDAIVAGDEENVPARIWKNVVELDRVWGLCKECRQPFRRNERGRPRKFCHKRCNTKFFVREYRRREKEGVVI